MVVGASERLRRGVLVASGLYLAVGAALIASPSRSIADPVAALGAVSRTVATYWLVAMALLTVADRLHAGGVGRVGVRRLSGGVFAGVVGIEAVALVIGVATGGPVADAALVATAVGAVQAALFPAAVVFGTGLAALALRDSAADGLRSPSLPVAPEEGVGHEGALAALWRLVRALAAAAALYLCLSALVTVATASEMYAVLAVATGTVDALDALAEHLALGVALFALFASGATPRTLVGTVSGTLAGAFLMGLAVGTVGALTGVVVVGATVTPIPAVESANLVRWPDPLAWTSLAVTGTALAVGLGVRLVHGALGGRKPRRDGSAGLTGSSNTQR